METKKQSTVSLLLNFAAPHKGKYISAVILAILGVIAGMIPYFSVARMVVALLDGNSEIKFYLIWCGIAALSFIAKGILENISTAISHKPTFTSMKELRHNLISKLSRLPMGKLIDTPSSYYKDIIVDRVESIEVPLAHLLPEMTANILVPILMLIYLLILDWRMALISLITIPLGIFFMAGTM